MAPAKQVMEQKLLRKISSGGHYGQNPMSSNSYVETLTPDTSEWDCLWRQGLKNDKVKMR